MAMLMTNEVFARTWGERAGRRRRGVLAGRDRRASRRRARSSCSSPRPTGTWSGRSSSRASTTATTSGSTTGWSTRAPRPCAATCRPTPPTRSGCCASSRTTTSRARPRRSAPGQARAAAVVTSTLPGARLFHDGQLDGHRVHIPVFLGRGPDEPRRRRPARLLRAAAARRRRVRSAPRRLAAVRMHGLAGQRHAPPASSPGAGRRPAPATSWSSTSPASPPRPA